MSDQRTLHFYFDYISPYAYFAWRQIPALCEEYKIDLKIHPVVFGKLLDHWGQLGPAEIPPKTRWLLNYCMRYAALNGFEYKPPQFHPYNPLPSLRMSLFEVCGEQQSAIVSAIFEAGWSNGADLGDPSSLLVLLREAGIDAEKYLKRTSEPAIKNLLRQETESAIEAGVFGVPTMIVDDQLFWGNDQIEHLRLYLEGKDPLDPAKIAALGDRKRAIDRIRFVSGPAGSGTDDTKQS